MARLARQKRLSDAIDRLAALLPYGDLTAATDGGLLLASAADEIERIRSILTAHRRVVEAAIEMLALDRTGAVNNPEGYDAVHYHAARERLVAALDVNAMIREVPVALTPTQANDGIVKGIRYRPPGFGWCHISGDYSQLIADIAEDVTGKWEIEPFIMSIADFEALDEHEGW